MISSIITMFFVSFQVSSEIFRQFSEVFPKWLRARFAIVQSPHNNREKLSGIKMPSLGQLLHILYQWQWLPLLMALFVIYVTYYLIWVVKRPRIVCKEGNFRAFLLESCPILTESYWPTIWCFTSNAQTVLRALLRSKPQVPFRRETLEAPDGGIVCLDWFDNESSCFSDPITRPTVLILPGLTGGSETSYCRHLVLHGEKMGFRTIIANHRGFGESHLKTPRTFCAANTEDLRFVLSHINSLFPKCPVLAVGISMGGMILMNLLGEVGDKTNLVGGLAVSVPWNCMESCVSLEQPVNCYLFNQHLTRNLINMIKRNIAVFESHLGQLPYDINHVLKSRTIREFDERFTSPSFGYRNYEEYYSAATLHTKPLHAIKVPVLCLNAADDPFSPLHAIPLESLEQNSMVAMALTACGGHIGFLEGFMIHETNYMDRIFIQFSNALFGLVKEKKLHTLAK